MNEKGFSNLAGSRLFQWIKPQEKTPLSAVDPSDFPPIIHGARSKVFSGARTKNNECVMVNFSENNNCKISSNSLESSSQESNTSSREDLRSLGSRDSETQEGFDLGFDFSCLDVSDEDSKNDETFTVNFGTETIPDDLEEFQTCLEHLNDGYENVRLKELEVFGAVYETIRKINSSATEEEILEHLLDLRSSQESGSLADVSYSEIIYGLQQIWIMEQIAKNNALKKTEYSISSAFESITLPTTSSIPENGGTISAFPHDNPDNYDDECAICFETIRDGKLILDCAHIFHGDCIKEWFNEKAECPFCRRHIKLEEEYPPLMSAAVQRKARPILC